MQEIFNDGVLRATELDNRWVVVEWLTNKVGYLSKTVVKDLRGLESTIRLLGLNGWILGSEVENVDMHKLIQKFGGVLHTEQEGMKIFYKRLK